MRRKEGPCLTVPNVVRSQTLFLNENRKYLVPYKLSDLLKVRYRGYYFERCFILCCDERKGFYFWDRIITGPEIYKQAVALAAVPGWKRIEWTIEGYRAAPVDGDMPDWRLAPVSDEVVWKVLRTVYGEYDEARSV